MPYHVYMLKCSDQSYYIGMTSDIEKRLDAHNSGRGSSWTAKRRPVQLVFKEQHETKSKALKREQQLKGWSRAKKEALINGDIDLLRTLSKSHSDDRNNAK